jgi:hypothetical protein
MAGDIKQKYGTDNQAINITLAGLANNAARQSDEVDNTTNLYQDALVALKIKSGATGTTTIGTINVYAYATVTVGAGSPWRTENAGAADAAITLTVPPNAKLIGIINVVANGVTYNAGPFSVASVFGYILPEKWGIIVENKTGGALDATEANHDKRYQGCNSQYT